MFWKKSKDEPEKKSKKDKGTNNSTGTISARQSLPNVLTNISVSRQYSQTTNFVQTTETRTAQSISTSSISLDNIQKPGSGSSYDKAFKRLSVDATPFRSPSSPGYQSPFNRRLTPISSSTRGTSSTASPTSYVNERIPRSPVYTSTGLSTNIPSASIRPSSSSSAISRLALPQNSIYSSEKVIPIRKTSVGSVPRIYRAGSSVSESVVPEYNTKGAKRANVLIINNIKFLDKKSHERTGAELDENNLVSMFKNFGFDVEKYRDLKRNEILKKVQNYRSARSLGQYDMSIVIIMSHGKNTLNDIPIPGGYTEIIGIDGQGISTEDIINEFTAQRCPAMRGKPKIFIFQCCRGSADEIQVDSAPNASGIKNNADVLVAYSTLPGFYSYRQDGKGSWYIYCICQVFQEHAKQHHVEDLLKIVEKELFQQHPVQKQTSTYHNRGFKNCYLNPK